MAKKKKRTKMIVPKVKFEMDMISIFEMATSEKDRKVREALRPLLSNPAFKSQLGFNVIEKIRIRTLKSIDRNNKKFPAYSSRYKASDDFRIYGKSSKVNLRLSGEMLASMKVGKSQKFTLKIIMADKENNDKAHGHITGNIAKVKSKAKRDFLGLPIKDQVEVMKQTLIQYNADSIESLVNVDDILDEFQDGIQFNIENGNTTNET